MFVRWISLTFLKLFAHHHIAVAIWIVILANLGCWIGWQLPGALRCCDASDIIFGAFELVRSPIELTVVRLELGLLGLLRRCVHVERGAIEHQAS